MSLFDITVRARRHIGRASLWVMTSGMAAPRLRRLSPHKLPIFEHTETRTRSFARAALAEVHRAA